MVWEGVPGCGEGLKRLCLGLRGFRERLGGSARVWGRVWGGSARLSRVWTVWQGLGEVWRRSGEGLERVWCGCGVGLVRVGGGFGTVWDSLGQFLVAR